jgi:hypothetical protein
MLSIFVFASFTSLMSVVESTPVTFPGNSSQQLNQSTGNVTRQGWTSQSDGRGTLDILWSCGFTMFLCSWSVLCLNVPAPGESRFRIFRRKIYMTALAFLGPEFIFQIALGQLVSARQSLRDFHASGFTAWTMTHAFYADMGGFVLQTRDWVPFPIDAKQLHYLVVGKYVKLPTIARHEIADRNKVDGLLRILTVCQILWFIINMASRASQHLVITCGELTTAAFIVCSIGTSFCWIYKPADVVTFETLETDASISEILIAAGKAASEPYSRTPLDFVSRKEWAWSLYWSNWINILRNLGIEFGPQTRPVNRFENTLSHELPGVMRYVFLGMSAIYTSIFACGWKYSFPTRTETLLWRAASGSMLGTLVAYWAITEYAFTIHPWIERYLARNTSTTEVVMNSDPDNDSSYGWLLSKARSVAASVRNNSVSKDSALTVPLKAILPIYVVGVFYCHARTYIFIADIIQLRSLPPSAYSTVDWTELIPHF